MMPFPVKWACAVAIILAGGCSPLLGQPGQVPQYDAAAVERGKASFVAACGFCHGANARGGESGPDLLRSVVVLDDEGGKELGEFLRMGRPGSGMPAFAQIHPEQILEIATFLHSQITAAAYRRTYKVLDILVGDARAGQAFFNGVGGCHECHSIQGNLKGVGAKYEPEVLQGKIVMPRATRPPGAAATADPPIAVTVSWPSREIVKGTLVRVTDFHITLRDASGIRRTFARNADVPKVELIDPLQAHIDLLGKYTDKDIHDLTAYLASVK